MTEQTRWNLVVSRETDRDVRSFLAERGGRKGDLSKFVQQAVRRAMLQATLNEVWERNKDLDPEQMQRMVDEELAEVRRERRERDLEI